MEEQERIPMESGASDLAAEEGSQPPPSESVQAQESAVEFSTVVTQQTPEHLCQNGEERALSNSNSFSLARPGVATDPEPLRNLIVNYLPPMMDEMELCGLFGQFGPIESVKIIYDRETRESRGYGFVKYVYYFSASYAANSLNGYCIAGKRLKVAYANVEAAWEAYNSLRASAMMFSLQQQAALQTVFYQQMLLARQEEDERRQR
ncbi:RNA-binding protein RBP-3 [Trypanosoma rangeli]|uniref:RNA-binding protein RBP-3 n=1 Tax=Trypanosoma rangeli TaxID=5698 RepID=A0A422NXA6_TRYRA|nr:RNA-binding protein RBP-3 [Trypanosoma rangeli]RNF10034.1 RNA-binding protein RBP-3 [Trypanosoma rangeli]|eukprot:RNF10034.1 RNA-binding protein RBP-3 [Trypanosoma rangeli]